MSDFFRFLICVIAALLDLLAGALAALNPAAAQELLYPELSLKGGLIGVEQLGWLTLGRAAVGLLALPALNFWLWYKFSGGVSPEARLTRSNTRAIWGWLWLAWTPMEVWSALALAHLGPAVFAWHAARALLGGALWWALAGEALLSPPRPPWQS